MTQYLRPDSDISLSNWTGSYASIDETSYSDGDYITGSGSGNGTAEFGLSNINEPSANTGHTIRFRAWQQNNSNQRTLSVYLYQGATLISSYSGNPITLSKVGAQAYNWTISTGEADNITDYDDLRLYFTSGGAVGAPAKNRSSVYVSWAEVEAPDGLTPDALTSLDITSGTPAIEQATIGQKHVLTSVDVVSGTPALETPTVGQVHALTVLDIVSGTPTIEQATAGEELADTEDNLTALDIVMGVPVIEQSTLGQVHVLTSQDILSGVPTIETLIISQVHVLTANDIQSGTPIIEQATVGELEAGTDNLTALDVVVGTPTMESATIGQIHNMTASNIVSGTPAIELITLAQIHGLVSQDITSGQPTIDMTTLTGFVLVAVSLGLLPSRSLSCSCSVRDTDCSCSGRDTSVTLGRRNGLLI
jgi:hypothetical protein